MLREMDSLPAFQLWRWPNPRAVADAGPADDRQRVVGLDFDDLRALVGEDARGGGAGVDPGEIQHADAPQGEAGLLRFATQVRSTSDSVSVGNRANTTPNSAKMQFDASNENGL